MSFDVNKNNLSEDIKEYHSVINELFQALLDSKSAKELMTCYDKWIDSNFDCYEKIKNNKNICLLLFSQLSIQFHELYEDELDKNSTCKSSLQAQIDREKEYFIIKRYDIDFIMLDLLKRILEKNVNDTTELINLDKKIFNL